MKLSFMPSIFHKEEASNIPPVDLSVRKSRMGLGPALITGHVAKNVSCSFVFHLISSHRSFRHSFWQFFLACVSNIQGYL